MLHQWQTTRMIELGTMKIGLFETPNAATMDDLDNKIAVQLLASRVSAEEFIAAQIQLGELNVQIEGVMSKNSNGGQWRKNLRSKLIPGDWVTAEIDQDGAEAVLKPVGGELQNRPEFWDFLKF